jgi:hypothetical protein
VAVANQQPTIDVQAGAAALDEDIPRVLRVLNASSLEQLRWQRPNRLTLLVPFNGTYQDRKDEFLLRLGFAAYRRWPPSAQFVNPETLAYIYPQDQQFVPVLKSSACTTHVAYKRNQHDSGIQLVCCSATLEFYEVLHGVETHHLWRETDTLLTTIMAIRRAFSSSYEGRFPGYGR